MSVSESQPAESQPAPVRPSAPPAWKQMMHVTAAITLLLFLTPTFYVLKYYAVDRPNEETIATSAKDMDGPAAGPDQLLRLEKQAQSGDVPVRQSAVQGMGETLRRPGIGWKRPLECLSAKATLAELATKDPDPAVRAAASEELGKVAQAGAVIRR